jgi:hypothetical protein
VDKTYVYDIVKKSLVFFSYCPGNVSTFFDFFLFFCLFSSHFITPQLMSLRKVFYGFRICGVFPVIHEKYYKNTKHKPSTIAMATFNIFLGLQGFQAL